MKKKKQFQISLFTILLLAVVFIWWRWDSISQLSFVQTVISFFHQYRVLLLVAVLLILVAWLGLYISRQVFRYRRTKDMKTVRIILSRAENQSQAEIINFFDFLNGTLLPEFPWMYSYKGAHTFVWEIRVGKRGEKNIYLSAASHLLPLILKNLRTIYEHVRFEEVEKSHLPLPQEFMQMRLERSWKHSIETVEVNDQQGGKTLTDSLFQTLDEIDGEGGVQFVVSPLSLYKQQRKRLQHKLAKIGGSLFECEIRIFASSKAVQKGLIGTLGEVNAYNNIVPEGIIRYQIRRWMGEYWWNELVAKQRMSYFFGPKMWFASYQLAMLLQFPSSKLRVRGMFRYQHRRLPIPQGMPVDEEVASPIAVTDEGVQVGLNEEMWKQNLLVLGTGGTGKTTTLGQHASHWFAKKDEGAVVIGSQPHELMFILQFVPDYKKVYIIDMDKPSQYGINFLSNDAHPADMMVEDLVSIFDPPFAGKIKNMDFIANAFLALRQVRDYSPIWKKAIPSIDLRHIKEVLANEKYRVNLIQSLPRDSNLRRYWIERTQLMRNPRYYVNYIAPIITVFDRLLSIDRVAKTLCHPQTIDLRKALFEERAVIALHGGKWDYGFNVSDFAGNMLLALLYHTLLPQREWPDEKKVNVNLVLDDFGGFCSRILMMLMVRAWKINIRAACAAGTWFDIPESMRTFLNIVFPNKMLFRQHNPNDAKHWGELLDLLEEEDFLTMRHHYAAMWFKVDGDQKDPFIAKAIYDRNKALWEDYHIKHNWPKENPDLKLYPLIMPEADGNSLASYS